MARPRTTLVAADEELTALIAWIHERLDETGTTYRQIAQDLPCDPSWISRSLRGQRLPAWAMVEAVAVRCDASTTEARRLWDAANAARRTRQARDARRFPPGHLASAQELCAALEDLVIGTGISHRELTRRNHELARSTVGAVLRRERSLSMETMIRILEACGLDDDVITAWQSEWDRLYARYWESMDRLRRQLAYDSLRAWR